MENYVRNRRLLILVAAILTMAFAVTPVLAETSLEEQLTATLLQLKDDSPWGIVNVEGSFELWQAQAAVFLDVRSPEDFEAGHIPGAINVMLDTLPENLDQLPGDKEALIVVYCKSGWRANLGMMTLRLLGYVNAKGFNGSWLAWVEAEHPINEGTDP